MQRSQEVGHRLPRHRQSVMPGRNELGSGNDLVEGPLVDHVLGSDAFSRQLPLPYPPPDRLRIATDTLRRLGNREHRL